MFNFDQEDRDRITQLLELVGAKGTIREQTHDDNTRLEITVNETADWRRTLNKNNDYNPAQLVDYEIHQEGELLSLLSSNGYEFRVEPRFEVPTRIFITGFDTTHEAEYQDLYVPSNIETRYQTHATETTSPAELDVGDTIIDPKTGAEVTVLNVHEADAQTFILAVGESSTDEFIGQREFQNTDSVALPDNA
ncbi:hypothetical protein [Salinibaculum rarum]|uniref:hypothetical protein n=1 Tax=Salinibaculum rarum TaxID=3058903 RepID=UPI00265E0998|nr:hypothetical protein [Salinibaculum sp. KK48]